MLHTVVGHIIAPTYGGFHLEVDVLALEHLFNMDFTRNSHHQMNAYFMALVVPQFATQNLMVKMPDFRVSEDRSGSLVYMRFDPVYYDETRGKQITFRL
jgi:hypothetical protein